MTPLEPYLCEIMIQPTSVLRASLLAWVIALCSTQIIILFPNLQTFHFLRTPVLEKDDFK